MPSAAFRSAFPEYSDINDAALDGLLAEHGIDPRVAAARRLYPDAYGDLDDAQLGAALDRHGIVELPVPATATPLAEDEVELTGAWGDVPARIGARSVELTSGMASALPPTGMEAVQRSMPAGVPIPGLGAPEPATFAEGGGEVLPFDPTGYRGVQRDIRASIPDVAEDPFPGLAGVESPGAWDVVSAAVRNPARTVGWALRQGLSSVPDMALALANLPAYAVALSGLVAEERAEAQGIADPTASDRAIADVVGVVSAVLGRAGANVVFRGLPEPMRTRLLGGGQTLGGRLAGDVAGRTLGEGVIEGAQSGVEAVGRGVWTPRGVEGVGGEMAMGAIGGMGAGGALGGLAAGVEHLYAAPRRDRLAAQAEAEAAAEAAGAEQMAEAALRGARGPDFYGTADGQVWDAGASPWGGPSAPEGRMLEGPERTPDLDDPRVAAAAAAFEEALDAGADPETAMGAAQQALLAFDAQMADGESDLYGLDASGGAPDPGLDPSGEYRHPEAEADYDADVEQQIEESSRAGREQADRRAAWDESQAEYEAVLEEVLGALDAPLTAEEEARARERVRQRGRGLDLSAREGGEDDGPEGSGVVGRGRGGPDRGEGVRAAAPVEPGAERGRPGPVADGREAGPAPDGRRPGLGAVAREAEGHGPAPVEPPAGGARRVAPPEGGERRPVRAVSPGDAYRPPVEDMEETQSIASTPDAVRSAARRQGVSWRMPRRERAQTVHLPAQPGSTDVFYGVVDAGDVKASFGGGMADAGYAVGKQPRDRRRATSDVQIAEIAGSPEFGRVAENPGTLEGAPLVDPDLDVISGNARMLGLRTAYAKGQAGEYRKQLGEWAKRRGLDLGGMDRPVLVRMATRPPKGMTWAQFAEAANAPAGMAQSAQERARTDEGGVLADPVLDALDPTVDVAVDESLRNQEGMRGFVGRLPTTERGDLVDRRGHVLPALRARVARAVMRKAYGGDGWYLGDGVAPSLAVPMRRAAVAVAQADRSGARGVGEAVERAARASAEYRSLAAKERPKTIAAWMAQPRTDAEPYTADEVALAGQMEALKGNPRQLGDVLTAYGMSRGQEAEPGMFGPAEPASVAEIAEGASARVAARARDTEPDEPLLREQRGAARGVEVQARRETVGGRRRFLGQLLSTVVAAVVPGVGRGHAVGHRAGAPAAPAGSTRARYEAELFRAIQKIASDTFGPGLDVRRMRSDLNLGFKAVYLPEDGGPGPDAFPEPRPPRYWWDAGEISKADKDRLRRDANEAVGPRPQDAAGRRAWRDRYRKAYGARYDEWKKGREKEVAQRYDAWRKRRDVWLQERSPRRGVAFIDPASGPAEALWSLAHEGLHYVESVGGLTRADAEILKRDALDRWIEQYDIVQRYGSEGTSRDPSQWTDLDRDLFVREAVAEALGQRMVDRMTAALGRHDLDATPADRIFDRVIDFFGRVVQAARSMFEGGSWKGMARGARTDPAEAILDVILAGGRRVHEPGPKGRLTPYQRLVAALAQETGGGRIGADRGAGARLVVERFKLAGLKLALGKIGPEVDRDLSAWVDDVTRRHPHARDLERVLRAEYDSAFGAGGRYAESGRAIRARLDAPLESVGPSEVQYQRGAAHRPEAEREGLNPGERPSGATGLRRRQGIVRSFARAIGAGVYTGRVVSTKVAGYMKQGTGEVRVRRSGDAETAAHEIAHLVDVRTWGKWKADDAKGYVADRPHMRNARIRAEMESLSYDASKPWEGWAEFVRTYMTQPEHAKAAAPTATAWMDKWIGSTRNPVGKPFREAAKELRDWYTASPVEQARTKIGPERTKREWESERKDWPEGVRDARWRVRQRLTDDLAGAERMMVETGQRAGGDAFERAQLSRAASSIVEEALTRGVPVRSTDAQGNEITRFGGKGLVEILKPVVGKDYDDFMLYIVGRSAAELRGQGRENLFSGTQIGAMQGLAEGKPHFAKAADDLQGWFRGLTDFAIATGLISEKQRAGWQRDFYVPFYRETSPQSGRTPRGDGERVGGDTGIRRLRGGEGNLRDISANLVANAQSMIETSLINEARRGLVDAALKSPESARWLVKLGKRPKLLGAVDTDGIAASVSAALRSALGKEEAAPALEAVKEWAEGKGEQIQAWALVNDPKRIPGERIVAVIRKGEVEYYEIAPDRQEARDFFQSLARVKPPARDAVLRNLNRGRRAFQGTITMSGNFVLRNYWRDTWQAWAHSKTGFIPIWSSMKGAFKVLSDSEAYRSYLAAGGMAGTQSTDPDSAREALQAAAKKMGARFPLSSIVSPMSWVRGVEKVNWAFEAAARVEEFDRARKQGRGEAEAAYLARDFANYSLRGDLAALNLAKDNIPFLSAGWVGLDKAWRGLSRAEKAKMATAYTMRLAYYGLAGTALYAMVRDNPLLVEAEEWERDAYLMIPVPNAKRLGEYRAGNAKPTARLSHQEASERYEVLRLPKSWEMGSVMSVGQRLVDAAATGKWGAQMRHIPGILASNFRFDWAPWYVRPLLEAGKPWGEEGGGTNVHAFTGRPVEGVGMERLPPGMRAGASTSPAMKHLGKATLGLPYGAQISPARADHIGRGFLNAFWVGANALVSHSFYGEEIPQLDWRRIPGVSVGVKAQPGRTKHDAEFYRWYREALSAAAGFEKMRTSPHPPSQATTRRYAEKGAMAPQLRAIARQLSNLRKSLRQIREHPGMSPKAKRERETELRRRYNQLMVDVGTNPGLREAVGAHP